MGWIFLLFSYFSAVNFNMVEPTYFSTFPISLFTMLQIMSLDGWGNIGLLIILNYRAKNS
jgi:hypothetical protein